MSVLHLFVHTLMRRNVQNNSFNGGSDAVLEGALHGTVNIALESAP